MITKTGEISGHSGAIYDLAFSDHHMYSASADGYVARWDTHTLEQDSFSIKCTTPPYSLVVAKDKLWFGLSSGDIHVVDLVKKAEVKFYQQHKKSVFSLVHVPQKNLIIAGDADGNLSIWNDENLSLLLFLPLDCGKIRKINVKSDGTLFVVHGKDEKIRIFETEHFNEIVTLPGHENGANCSVFSETTENQLISGGKDGLLKVWDWKKEKLIQTIPAHNYAIYDLKTSDDHQTLISVSRDKSIKLWNMSDLQFLQKVENKTGGHKHSVNSVIKDTNGHFFSASDDRKIIRWEIA
jgi:WD40 repeat protein